MARNIPKALATFVSNDTDTARMFNNLQSAIQPLLDFNNKWFQDKGSALNVRGALQAAGVAVSSGISGALTSFRKVPDGTIAAPGLAFLNNTAIGIEREGTGNSEQWNFVYNGVKFLSITKSGYIWTCFASTAGLMLFNNAAGTLLGSLNNLGVLNMPSFVSGKGFPQTIAMGTLTNATLPANTGSPVLLVAANGQALQAIMPFDGSVIGLGVNSASSTPVQFFIARSGSIIFNGTNTVSNTSFASNYQTMNKGAVPFSAGNYLNISARSNNTTSPTGVYCQAYITVEMGA